MQISAFSRLLIIAFHLITDSNLTNGKSLFLFCLKAILKADIIFGISCYNLRKWVDHSSIPGLIKSDTVKSTVHL